MNTNFEVKEIMNTDFEVKELMNTYLNPGFEVKEIMNTYFKTEELEMCPELQALPRVESTIYQKDNKILIPRFMGVKVSVSPDANQDTVDNAIEKGRKELDTVLSFLVKEGFAEALLVPTSLIRFAPNGSLVDFGIVCYIMADRSKPMPEYAKEYETHEW